MSPSPVRFCEPDGGAVADAALDAGDGGADASDGEVGDASGQDASTFDASAVDSGAGDGSVNDAAVGVVAPPQSENRCLIAADVTLSCPSMVGSVVSTEGQRGTTEMLVSQRGVSSTNAQGFLEGNHKAYVQYVHVDPRSGTGHPTLDPVAPYEVVTPAKELLSLLPASSTRGASLVVEQSTSTASSTLAAAPLADVSPLPLGASLALASPMFYQPFLVTSASGEGFLAGHDYDGPITVVRGLPDAPRAVPTQVSAWSFAVTASGDGLAGLFFDGTTLRLLEGEGFATERWSRPLRLGVNAASFDLAYIDEAGARVPAVLVREGDTDPFQVNFVRSSEPSQPYARVGATFSTCPRSSYVGITCDACPVDQRCEVGEDDIRTARFVVAGKRLFVVYLSTDVRQTLAYVRDTTPVIGVGCACTLNDRGKQEFADSLVVVEVVAGAPNSPPVLVERMRVPLFKAHGTGFVSITARSDGDADVVVGPSLVGYDGALTQLPAQPSQFRVLRVATSSIP